MNEPFRVRVAVRGYELDVSCEFVWGEGKTYRVRQGSPAPATASWPPR
jgi:hypothetical protein